MSEQQCPSCQWTRRTIITTWTEVQHFFYLKGSQTPFPHEPKMPVLMQDVREAGLRKDRREQVLRVALKGLIRAQIRLSPAYILWHFSPRGIQENSINGASH